MANFVVRVWLPDRPGALGLVASRIGAIGGDIVGVDVLERSETTTYCPYKGTTTYWHARVGDQLLEDVAWTYDEPLPESARLERVLALAP